MVRKEGKIPCNVRVDVDYTVGKPNIKFGYTSKNPKKDAYKQNLTGLHTIFLFLILFLLPYIILILISNTMNYSEYPKDCTVEFNQNYVDKTISIKRIDLSCDNGEYSMKFRKDFSFFIKQTSFYPKESFNFLNVLFVVIYFLLFAPLLIYTLNRGITKYLIKQKWYQKWFPKSQAEGAILKRRKKDYVKFTNKDMLENVLVIPKFSNVELDYKTFGDFSEQLEKIKIREYITQRINVKTNKKSKKKIDNMSWYAIFYFKQKPKDGYLEVIFQ